mmetsp:Transcript_50424/g.108704  ORF Transcript_50424/g.108704 Transcript_50424/m.108704 type:complete len:98 (+) Transcript_50424:87-380(+)
MLMLVMMVVVVLVWAGVTLVCGGVGGSRGMARSSAASDHRGMSLRQTVAESSCRQAAASQSLITGNLVVLVTEGVANATLEAHVQAQASAPAPITSL